VSVKAWALENGNLISPLVSRAEHCTSKNFAHLGSQFPSFSLIYFRRKTQSVVAAFYGHLQRQM
jgi:hypothetical protein